MENLDESVVVTDPDGIIVYANRAVAELSGYSVEDLVGQHVRIFGSGEVPSEVFAQMWTELHRGRSWAGRFKNRRRDGTIWVEEVTISPVYTEDRITHYVKVARDLTQELEFERELRQAHRMDSVAVLTGGIAHEFNNLLGVVSGYAEFVRDDLPAELGTAREDLDRILVACDRGAELVSQLLTFSRQREGKPVRFDPVPLLKETVKMLREGFSSRVTIELEVGPDIPPIHADPSLIRQAVVNLCTNGAQAYGEDPGLLVVRITSSQEGVRISVEDQGPGMSESTLERAVEPFFTTHQRSVSSGMGLSVVHGIVQEAGGTMSLRSRPGEGTIAEISLPPAPPEAGPPTTAAPSPTTARRALLVDDEAALVATLRRRLELMGLEVEGFTDPAAALRRLDQPDPDFQLLLTDLTMPGHDGREVARRFRGACPSGTVVLITGFGPQEAKAADSGGLFDHVLYKPVRRAELEELLDQAR